MPAAKATAKAVLRVTYQVKGAYARALASPSHIAPNLTLTLH